MAAASQPKCERRSELTEKGARRADGPLELIPEEEDGGHPLPFDEKPGLGPAAAAPERRVRSQIVGEMKMGRFSTL